MELKGLTKEELETMNYSDLAYLILNEEKTKMKINILFKKICDILNLNNQEYENKIVDFFELLTTDKRFIMFEDGSWDLKDLHNPKVIIEEEDDETILEDLETDLENDLQEEESEEDIFYDADSDDDMPDSDLEDLVVIDIDDEDENN